jgi:hypothetical protein
LKGVTYAQYNKTNASLIRYSSLSAIPDKTCLKALPFLYKITCELVDTTGRIIRADKAGAIDSAQSPILSRLGLCEEQWITLTTEFEQHFCYAAGAEQMMKNFKIHTHRKRIGGMRQAKRLLS